MSDFQDLDYYELLGVPRTATQDEIKRAYRREISKYHPDRLINPTPDEQQYAQQRSQRLTEAYAALSDFRTRSAYNTRHRPASQTPTPIVRDHQAELYDQAVAHLQAGHTLQAIGVLRQLQQINPFYRDSADLLARAEAQAESEHRPKASERSRRPLFMLGGLGSIAVIGFAAWALAQRGTLPGSQQRNAVGAAVTAESTVAPAPTGLPLTPAGVSASPLVAVAPTEIPTLLPTIEPTVVPTVAPTIEPTVVPTVVPTVEPTVPPTPAPTAVPTATPLSLGAVLFSEDFSIRPVRGWAQTNGRGWSVGFRSERYRIAVDPYIGAIWSYRTVSLRNYQFAADVAITRGEGGLLLAFTNEDDYLSFVVNPQQTSYRLERRRGDTVEVLVGGQNEAIRAGRDDVNRLVARVVGDRVQLLINDQSLAEVTVSDPPRSARIGLVGISGVGAAEAFFDNLEIRAVE